MKLLPIQLSAVPPGNARSSEASSNSSTFSRTTVPSIGQSVTGNGNNMDQRLSFLNPAMLWSRYGTLAFSPHNITNSNLDFQNQLPTNLACDPRLWNKEDVLAFLRWCESEFDLPQFDVDLFQMNGKALCLLTKQDLGERCPGAGDLLHNVLQWLIRDVYNPHLPRSPITPHFPIPPSWCLPMPQDYPHVPNTPTTLHNSVTLSPAPSIDSQSGSPKQSEQPTSSALSAMSNGKCEGYRNGTTNGMNNNGNNQSDSDVEDAADRPLSPTLLPVATSTSSPPYSPRYISKSSSGQIFFPPSDTANSTEPNTNGRLLWDFLQQLLNDPMQRYTNYITWKNRDSGVFKIVDPPGLARLWGIQKNHLSMNYDKMSRALRYYYRVNILRKVQGERHCYQFLRNPSELKNIKNISLLRQQMSPSHMCVKVKPEPEPEPEPEPMDENMSEDVGPTDLSINQNSNSRLRTPSPKVKTENTEDCFQYPQDLSISPVHLLQLNMEAREGYLSSTASNSVPSQIQIKIEDTSTV